jgi:hypothetical protein
MRAADFIARLITDTMEIHLISLIRVCVGITPSPELRPHHPQLPQVHR